MPVVKIFAISCYFFSALYKDWDFKFNCFGSLTFHYYFGYEPVHEKTNNLGFRPGPTNQVVQSQHKARSLKLWI